MAMTMGQLASAMAEAAQRVEPELDKALAQFVQVGTGIVKRTIQDVHAVDTATMLNSTTAEKAGKLEYLVGPTVDYAVYVALGTSRVEARPFHIMAANEMRRQAPDFGLNLGV